MQVERFGDLFVLVCSCGWRSSPGHSAEAVCTEWDGHRESDRVGQA